MGNQSYDKQNRGGRDEYAQYYAGMDKSMAQKVALATSCLALHGTIVDMGSGSGERIDKVSKSYIIKELFISNKPKVRPCGSQALSC